MELEGAISALSSADLKNQLHGFSQVQALLAAVATPEDATTLKELLQPHTHFLPAVVKLLHNTNSDVQREAVRTVCMLLGDADAPVNQELIASTPGALEGLQHLLISNDDAVLALASTTLRHLAIRNPANQGLIGATPGILDSLVPMLDNSCSTEVQRCAAAALMYITAGHQPNQGRVGTMPNAIPHLTSLLGSSDAGVQFVAAYTLSALADIHTANQKCIAQSGALPVLVGLLSSTDGAVREGAACALLNMCSISPQDADWVDSCAGAIDSLVSLLHREEAPVLTSTQSTAALTLILLASCNSSVRRTLEQHASAVWSALPCGLVSKLGLHRPEVQALLRALRSLASASTGLHQSMQDSSQLLLMLEGLQYVCDEATAGELQELIGMLSAGGCRGQLVIRICRKRCGSCCQTVMACHDI